MLLLLYLLRRSGGNDTGLDAESIWEGHVQWRFEIFLLILLYCLFGVCTGAYCPFLCWLCYTGDKEVNGLRRSF